MPVEVTRMVAAGLVAAVATFGIAACSTTVSGRGTASGDLPSGSVTSSASSAPAAGTTASAPTTAGASATTAAAPPTGAGRTDRLTACIQIQSALQSVITKAQQQLADTSALARIYRDGATEIRAASNRTADAGVRLTGLKIATAMDGLSTALATGQVPDPAPMTTAGLQLQAACS